MDPHAMGMQGSMAMPTSMGMVANNPQAMAMGMYAQPQMMMNMGQMPMTGVSMPMAQPQPQQMMNPAAVSGAMQMGGAPSADWRIQLTREHRANLIAKIYNEMVRVSADPVPGIKLWMNVSWYELTLYKESPTQEVYINKIFTRLKSLRAQQSDMNAAMAAQGLPNQGMLSRLDFTYYNTLNLSQRGASGGQMASYPGHIPFGGPGPHPGAQQPQQQQQQKTMASGGTPVKTDTSMTASAVAEYWTQHSALRAKHQGDVEKVHSAFKKYVDHMKGHDETEQKKKLRYLLSYVELCANILSEDKATHPPRKIEELDKVFKYIVKIVNPYLKKLRTETDKRGYPTGDSSNSNAGAGGQPTSTAGLAAPTTSGGPTSTGTSTMLTSTSSGFGSAMTQPQAAGQTQQTTQQKQQQYIIQQHAQQMQQQQQRMRQQQMMQQQQMVQQQQQMQKGSHQQFSAQQANQMKQQQQNSQNAANQQSGQRTQQQLGPQGPARSQQNSSLQPQQKPQQPQQNQPQPQQNQQPPTSREENPPISSGLSLGLDDSFYGGMGNDLLQMPTPSGTSSGLMDFSPALSPTSFGGMDLLDWDDGTGQGTSGTNSSGGDSGDLMTFVETL